MVKIVLAAPPNDQCVSMLMDIVPINVPAMLGLDVLDAEKLYEDNLTNRLVHRHILYRGDEELTLIPEGIAPSSFVFGEFPML